MRKSLLAVAIVPAMMLGGCGSVNKELPNVLPDLPPVEAPPTPLPGVVIPPNVIAPAVIDNTAQTVIQVISKVRSACAFEPAASSVLAILNTFQPGIDSVGPVVTAICKAVGSLKTARVIRAGHAATVRGVALRGHFVARH
jgi:hypothetical protein